MIKSMTGYGSNKGVSGKLEISIELKSVNNRYLDCSIRMPRIYTAVEDKLKAVVQQYISRGKVDVFVTIDASKNNDTIISINEPIAEAYLKAFAQLAEKYNLRNDVSVMSLSKYQDVLVIEKQEADVDELARDMCNILEGALEKFNEMRTAEGVKLKNDILSRLDVIESLVTKAAERSPVTVAEYKSRLEQKMREVLENTNIDESRILTEAAIFADKVAVDEELVRLRSHISQYRNILDSDEPVGRKLDFLTQELNREANTTGSKGNDVEMARIVVDMKAEIEKIREQIQNVE